MHILDGTGNTNTTSRHNLFKILVVEGSHMDWKNKTFSSQGILIRLEKSEFSPNYWKNEGFLASFYFYLYSNFLIEVHLLNQFLYF